MLKTCESCMHCDWNCKTVDFACVKGAFYCPYIKTTWLKAAVAHLLPCICKHYEPKPEPSAFEKWWDNTRNTVYDKESARLGFNARGDADIEACTSAAQVRTFNSSTIHERIRNLDAKEQG